MDHCARASKSLIHYHCIFSQCQQQQQQQQACWCYGTATRQTIRQTLRRLLPVKIARKYIFCNIDSTFSITFSLCARGLSLLLSSPLFLSLSCSRLSVCVCQILAKVSVEQWFCLLFRMHVNLEACVHVSKQQRWRMLPLLSMQCQITLISYATMFCLPLALPSSLSPCWYQ